MWAQLITMRVKQGSEDLVPLLVEQLWATEQLNSGLVRSTAMHDQQDPSRFRMMVVFENEAKARARENDPRREAGLEAVRATMAKVFEGPPEYLALTVLGEMSP